MRNQSTIQRSFPVCRWIRLGLAFLFLCSGLLIAAPVNDIFTYMQPDGSTLKVHVKGDEFYANEFTLDGRRIIKDPVSNYWCYARISSDGKDLESTGTIATDVTRSSTDEVTQTNIVAPQEYRQRIDIANRARMGRDNNGRFIRRKEGRMSLEGKASVQTARNTKDRNANQTTVGTRRGLTLLFRFPDRLGDATITRDQVDRYCNQTSTHYTEFGNNGSVAEYFSDVSGGKLNYTSFVTNYFTTKHNRDYYTNPDSPKTYELIEEGLNALEAEGFDFRTLDKDGDGSVDALNVFYAGDCVNTWSQGLWPHGGSTYWKSEKTGIEVYDYQITNMGSELALNIFCHENGHMLCRFPDVYDQNFDSTGGAGAFCLMNGGGYSTNPCPPNGYLRYKAGWGTIERIGSPINAAKTLTYTNGSLLANQFIVYENPHSVSEVTANQFRVLEYYLMENIFNVGRHSSINIGGIAIWHVDEAGAAPFENYAHQTDHNNYEVALIQADNQRHFERYIWADTKEDLYYAGNSVEAYVNEFSDTSDSGPYDNNAHWWSGERSGLHLSAFSAPGNTMSFTLQTNAPARVGVSPANIQLLIDDTYQLRATVSGTSNISVTWSCTGGTISSTGLYKASALGDFTVTATSVSNPSMKGTATVKVNPGGSVRFASDFTSQSGCNVATNRPGYEGNGFIDMGGEGTWFEWNDAYAEVTADHYLYIRYANGGSASRPCQILVNDLNTGTVSFTVTGSWSDWGWAQITVPLKKTFNTIRILASNSAGGPNIDQIVIKPCQPTYWLTVDGGFDSSGYYIAGSAITIKADPAPAGQVFDQWVIERGSPTIADVNAPITTLTMPKSEVHIRATYQAQNMSNNLELKETLGPEKYLVSSNGQYRFTLQGDGNLVLRKTSGNVLWNSDTAGKNGASLSLQTDGNLVLYTLSGKAVWSSKTNGKTVTMLKLYDNGCLALMNGNTKVWSVNGNPPKT